jgi:hypothetical protein
MALPLQIWFAEITQTKEAACLVKLNPEVSADGHLLVAEVALKRVAEGVSLQWMKMNKDAFREWADAPVKVQTNAIENKTVIMMTTMIF